MGDRHLPIIARELLSKKKTFRTINNFKNLDKFRYGCIQLQFFYYPLINLQFVKELLIQIKR